MIRARRFWYGVALGAGIAWWWGKRTHPGAQFKGGIGGPARKSQAVRAAGQRQNFSGLRRFRA